MRLPRNGVLVMSRPQAGWLATVALLALSLPLAAATEDARVPPTARVSPVTDDYFGTSVIDPYRWMEAPDSTELKEWLTAQGRFTTALLERIAAHNTLLARIHELDQATVEIYGIGQAGGRYFYFRADPRKAVPQIMVRHGAEGAEKLLLDPSTLPQGGGHAEVGWFAPSPDGQNTP